MDLSEYLSSDATTLAGLVAEKDVTAVELLALARQRCDAVNPTINAVVAPLTEVADAQAVDPGLSGSFAGVPFLVKDLGQEYAGFPTSNGSRALADDVAEGHALVTQRFLDAGLVIFGKTNTPESGANDGGGSVRIPAACNGLVGLKTSRGIGPYGPQTGEVMFGMVTQGVVSRTVRASAALLGAIIGPDPGAGYAAALPPVPFAEMITQRPGTLRIGYSSSSAINAHPDREAVAAVRVSVDGGRGGIADPQG